MTRKELIEALAELVENEEGWDPVYFTYKDLGRHVDFVDLEPTKQAIADAIRKRGKELLQ